MFPTPHLTPEPKLKSPHRSRKEGGLVDQAQDTRPCQRAQFRVIRPGRRVHLRRRLHSRQTDRAKRQNGRRRAADHSGHEYHALCR